jgi:hypothetical protein
VKFAPCYLALLALTGGCASQSGEYPSLAIREAELAAGMAVPEVPLAPAPPRAALDRLGPLLTEARAAHSAFNQAAQGARARVNAAAGAASGSENWSVAQVALGDLRSRRSTAMFALADLDLLFNNAASAGESTADIAPVRAEVAQMLSEEDRLLDSLIGQLAR